MKRFAYSCRRLLPVAAVALALLGGCGTEDPQKLLESARQYQAANDPAAAIIQLKNALQVKPDLAEARFLLGQTLLQTGDASGSETELRKARELGQSVDALAPWLARALLTQGKAKALTDELSSVKLADPAAQAELLTLVAVAWRVQGEAGAARAALQEALNAKPEYTQAWIEQARAQAAAGDFDASLASLADVLRRDSKNDEALKLKGDILQIGKNDPKAALEAYRSALQVNPASREARVALVRALLAQKRLEDASKELQVLIEAAPGSPETLYLQAQRAMQQEDFQAASGFAQQLLRLSPDNPVALEINGVIDFRLGSMVKAESSLARAVQAAPQLTTARRVLLMTQLRTGQVDQAIAGLPSDIESSDKDAAMLAVAGQAYLIKGDVQRAERFFARANRLDPADPAKRTSLAISQLMGGKDTEALSALSAIAASDNGVTADLALINALMQRKDVDRALQAIEKLEKKLAQDPMPRQLRGRALLVRDDRAGARRAFEQALALSPDYFVASAALSALDVLEGKTQEARARFEGMIKKDGKHTQALMALADLRSAEGAPSQEVQDLLSRAVESAPANKVPRLRMIDHLLRRNEAKQAMVSAQAAVASLPDAPELLDALGRTQLASGDSNQAIGSFNRLTTLMPRSPLPFMRLASVHTAGKNPQAATQALKKALDIQPDHLPAQRALIDVALQTGDARQALEVARKVQIQRPKEGVGFALEGDVHVSTKDWLAAVRAYRSGLKVVNRPELVIKLHTALSTAGQTAEAARVSAEWQRTQPRDPTFPLYLGDLAIASAQWAEAARQYQRVVELQPNNALALNNWAWAAGQLKRPDAIALAEKANALAPNQPAILDTLATLLSADNQHDRAIGLQKQALAARPDAPLYKLNLAKMQINAGDKAAARLILQELSALGGAFPGQAEVQSLLKSI